MAQAAPFLMLGSSLLSAKGAYDDGKAQKEAADFQADQHRQQGVAAFAKGTRDAAEQRHKAAIVQSDARAASAGSGGAMDEGMVETLGDIQSKGEYNSLAVMFDAKTEQSNQNLKADTLNYEGDQAKAAGKRKALATILGGASSFAGGMS